MAVSSEQWPPAPELTLNYYPNQAGSSYATAFSLPMTSEYVTHQQVPGLLDTLQQSFVRGHPFNLHIVPVVKYVIISRAAMNDCICSQLICRLMIRVVEFRIIP